jgi:hypothetical protein
MYVICNNPCLLGGFHAFCSYSLMLTALNYLILCKQIVSGVRELMTNSDLISYKSVSSVELTQPRVI